jgi:hypothetical protein
LARGDAEAVAKHAECVALPAVEKRGKPAPRPEAEARPEGAAPNSQKCPYCEKWLPLFHRENCPSMPYELWIQATRQRQYAKHGAAVVDAWTAQCQHCATPFPADSSKRVHLSGCERRRREAELPMNMFPAIRRV